MDSRPTADALSRLRTLLDEVRDGGRTFSPVEFQRLADELGAAVTIDFSAVEHLGYPLVVLRDPEPSTDRFATLSKREREVAALLAKGLRNKDIAAKLFISVATVKDHVHRVLAKTGLDGRAAVAAHWRG